MTSPDYQPFPKERVIIGYGETMNCIAASPSRQAEFLFHSAEAESFMARGSVACEDQTHLPMVVIDLNGEDMPSPETVRKACTMQWGAAPYDHDFPAFSAPTDDGKDFGVLVLEKSKLVVLYLPVGEPREGAEERITALGVAVRAQLRT